MIFFFCKGLNIMAQENKQVYNDKEVRRGEGGNVGIKPQHGPVMTSLSRELFRAV